MIHETVKINFQCIPFNNGHACVQENDLIFAVEHQGSAHLFRQQLHGMHLPIKVHGLIRQDLGQFPRNGLLSLHQPSLAIFLVIFISNKKFCPRVFFALSPKSLMTSRKGGSISSAIVKETHSKNNYRIFFKAVLSFSQ